MKKIICCVMFAFILWCDLPDGAWAAEPEEFYNLLDTSGIDVVLEEKTGEKKSFTRLMTMVLEGEILNVDSAMEYVGNMLLDEIDGIRLFLKQTTGIMICFALMNQMVQVLGKQELKEYNHYVFYLLMAVILLQNFIRLLTILEESIREIMEFMQAMLPVYCLSVGISAGKRTGSAVYGALLVVIMIAEQIFLTVGLPYLQIYMVFIFANYAFAQCGFDKMTELLGQMGAWFLKGTVAVVLGINVIQGMLVPSMEQIKNSMLLKTAEMIPGLGNAGELLLGTGALLKNSIGVAGVIILCILMFPPILKIGLSAICLKLCGAVFEPAADRNMTGLLSGAGDVAMLMTGMAVAATGIFLLSLCILTLTSGGMI